MKVTITDEAVEETKSIAERQKMTRPAVYLDVVSTCCSLMPKVDVVDQALGEIEIIDYASGIPVSASDVIRKFLKENQQRNDLELKVDIIIPYGLCFQLLRT